MKPSYICLALCCCLGLTALPAHALLTCSKNDAAAVTVPPNPAANTAARLLAAVAPGNEVASPAYPAYVTAAQEGWQSYVQRFRQPLGAWAAKEVRADARMVFYPFSGPDLPSLITFFPAASHYVLVSDQYANRYSDPFSFKESEQTAIAQALGEAWTSFGQRGFFVTQELNKQGGAGRRFEFTPSMILMAFSARLGYEVRSIQPVCLDAASSSVRPSTARGGRWASVRLELRKDGRDIVVDYLQQDLSNRGLAKHPEAKAFIESLAKAPVLLKAASHLPQQPVFSQVRNAILAHSPLVVQDETGIEYDTLAGGFNVRLYGEYVGAHRLFREFVNPSLIRAYKTRSGEVRPLDFKLGYEKEAGSAIQVATRR